MVPVCRHSVALDVVRVRWGCAGRAGWAEPAGEALRASSGQSVVDSDAVPVVLKAEIWVRVGLHGDEAPRASPTDPVWAEAARASPVPHSRGVDAAASATDKATALPARALGLA